MKLTPHFRLEEFDCHDGTPVPRRLVPRVRKLAEQLEVLRAELGGRPITIISGYRTPEHNHKVGGAPRSQHKYGRAADIRVEGWPPAEVGDVVRRLIRQGKMAQGGVGQYRSFVHYDTRGRAARWSGSA